MRPVDRLFRILLLLRHGRVVTAAQLAATLEVSERTVYRDIAALQLSGVPVDGEAGVGYRLRRDFQVPPLMFAGDELAALAIGAKLVAACGDAALGTAAASALARIEAVLPRAEEARIGALSERYLAPDFMRPMAQREPLAALREGIAASRKVLVTYRRGDGELSQRCLWPLGLVFWGHCWTLGAWCELRQEFRTFRVDRIQTVAVSDEPFADRYGHLWQEYLARQRSEGDCAAAQ